LGTAAQSPNAQTFSWPLTEATPLDGERRLGEKGLHCIADGRDRRGGSYQRTVAQLDAIGSNRLHLGLRADLDTLAFELAPCVR
jgi:hypothetical protein